MTRSLYRKYRPKTLTDLLGHEANVTIIRNAAKQGQIGHAYLFHGPRGTGKTTLARILAKLLNCETRAADPKFRAQGEPCNVCTSCAEIDGNISLDVIEIDAASNRGIDEIRNLKENIRSAPTHGRFKVYIIDEAHMLTPQAFNALLKTLEEPPRHAIFVLATTEFEKLPATITSRTQRFLFKKLSKADILKKLRHIAKEEKIQIEPAALELIAATAEGSFRDAESLLEQMSTFEKSVTLESVEQLTGRTGLKKVEDLAEYILKGNAKGALAYLSEINEEGHDLVQFAKDLIRYFRKLLALTTNPSLEEAFRSELTSDEVVRLKNFTALVDLQKHLPFLKALIRAYSEMRYSPFAVVPLELVLIEHLA